MGAGQNSLTNSAILAPGRRQTRINPAPLARAIEGRMRRPDLFPGGEKIGLGRQVLQGG